MGRATTLNDKELRKYVKICSETESWEEGRRDGRKTMGKFLSWTSLQVAL